MRAKNPSIYIFIDASKIFDMSFHSKWIKANPINLNEYGKIPAQRLKQVIFENLTEAYIAERLTLKDYSMI